MIFWANKCLIESLVLIKTNSGLQGKKYLFIVSFITAIIHNYFTDNILLTLKVSVSWIKA